MDIFKTLNRLHVIPFIKKWNILGLILGLIDIFSITLAYQVAYYLNYYQGGMFFFTKSNFLILYMALMPFWLIVLYLIKISEIPRTKRYRDLFWEYLESASITFILLLIIYFIFKLYYISRLFLIELTIFGFLFLYLSRILEYKMFKGYRAKGHNLINVVLIADDTSLVFIEKLINSKDWGFKIIAIFTESTVIKDKYEKDIIILPEDQILILNDLMEVNIIDEVFYVKGKIIASEIRDVVRSCEELGVVFRVKYKDRKLNLTNAIKTVIADEKFLTFINIPHNVYAIGIKRIMDVCLSLFLIITLSPALIVISLAIKFTSPGPLIYKQTRVGLRGRPFELLKFRTMVINADQLLESLKEANEADGPAFKIKDDPRITKIGKILRKTGLDEMPQLFNILRGEMSLIGPRPPLPDETRQYKRWQLRRLSIKPGLSCFWQIEPDRNAIKFDKWMEMDLAYIDNWSLRLDFIIFFKTMLTVFKRTGL
ncbi:MAG TPA: sugar transferase [Bacteroidales bacterium]|nr:sugar transferase [Bacteroidales bacterium]